MKKKLLIQIMLILCMSIIPKNTIAETYDGEYSIDYLLRNYNIVTLKGNLKFTRLWNASGYNVNDNIEGPILINGDLISEHEPGLAFGLNSGNTKSYIKGTKGDNTITPSALVTDPNYIDFEKMYRSVLSESQSLAENTEYHINSAKLEISKPGIYTIDDTAAFIGESSRPYSTSVYNNNMLIKNYDKNKLYVFNYYNEFIFDNSLPNISVMPKETSDIIPLSAFKEYGQYSGNIIFNFPNAKNIIINFDRIYGVDLNYQNTGFIGNIIAPKATIHLGRNMYFFTNNTPPYSYIYGTIIADNIIYDSTYENRNIGFTNYTGNEKIGVEDNSDYFEEKKDYNDDIYSRDYSIKDLLENYSLVTLGKKNIDSKSTLLKYGNKSGSIKLFHITGQALINGDLYGEGDFKTAFDLESNKVNDSYISGKVVYGNEYNSISRAVIQPWDNMGNDNVTYMYRKNNLLVGSANSPLGISYIGPGNYKGLIDNYINFDRLYNNIVSEQKEIKEGTKINTSKGKAHIKIGGSYVIDNINDINEVIFDNFDDNKNKITVITIKNEGDINFPLISKDTGSYKGIVTNDYYGKEKATHLYEQDTFVQDSYHGNIVWNIPNATYIKLKENAPFAGHLIAPNADVETPELHFAGCFIVNSIYGEGNTEAHFYPLTATATYEVPEYDDLTPSELSNLSSMRLKRLLGGKGSIIETTVLGDEEEFRKEEAKLNDIIDKEETKANNSLPPIIEILQNPLTQRSIIIGNILTIIGVTLYLTFKKKNA